MSNNERFDDNIKEQFQDYNPDVHPRIWENIVKEREKRRPVGFWLSFFNGRNILLLAALLIAAGSGAYFLLKDPGSKKENDIAANTKPTITTAAANTPGNEKNKIDNKAIDQTGDQPGAGTLNNTVVDIAGNNSNNHNNNHKIYNSGSSSSVRVYTPFATGDENKTPGKKNKNNAGENNDYDIAGTDLTGGGISMEDYYLRRLLFNGLQKISTAKKESELNKRTFPNIYLPDCPSFEKDAAGNKTYIEVYGGPDFAFRNMSDTGNSAYLQKRKESTKFSSAFSAGIRYTKVFNNGVSIRTGINYSQINEKFTFVQGNLVQITYIIDANGDTTGSYITTGTRYKTTINKFRTIDVPILIGYEVGNGKLHANINAGVIINAYSWQKGDVLDTAFRPVSITTGKTNSPYQFKTNIGVGFMVGTSFYYKLNEKIHVMAEPYFRYSLSPMSKENLTFTQKYNTAGIRVGLRVDLH
jgi:hypothetical protein